MLLAWPGLVAGQLPAGVPPEPGHEPGLAALGAWIERWLPVVGAASYQPVEQTGDFFARASDSVTAARLDGCTLVLQQRSISIVRGETLETRRIIRVPLAEIDTTEVRPRIRGAQMFLTSPNVLVRGQLVVPLRSAARTRFIPVSAGAEPGDSLVAEHLVPIRFAEVPAARAARAIRRAAAHCISREPRE